MITPIVIKAHGWISTMLDTFYQARQRRRLFQSTAKRIPNADGYVCSKVKIPDLSPEYSDNIPATMYNKHVDEERAIGHYKDVIAAMEELCST